jgi:2-methylcitrate dehydratase PrpD
MAAQYSIPYAVIVTLCRGRPGVEDFSEQALRDHAVRSLLRRCKVVKHDRFSGMGKITVRFRDGGAISAPVVDTNLPIAKTSKEAVVNKFFDLTSAVFAREQAEKVIETIDGLEHLRDVRRLTEMIVSKRLGSRKVPIAGARAGGRVY